MGLFGRTPVTGMAGVVDRIGISRSSDVTLEYELMLVGDPAVFTVPGHVGGKRHVNRHVTMARPGDRVEFGIRGEGGLDAVDYFRNLDMAA